MADIAGAAVGSQSIESAAFVAAKLANDVMKLGRHARSALSIHLDSSVVDRPRVNTKWIQNLSR
jgi:hypothetical protein